MSVFRYSDLFFNDKNVVSNFEKENLMNWVILVLIIISLHVLWPVNLLVVKAKNRGVVRSTIENIVACIWNWVLLGVAMRTNRNLNVL